MFSQDEIDERRSQFWNRAQSTFLEAALVAGACAVALKKLGEQMEIADLEHQFITGRTIADEFEALSTADHQP